MMKTISKNQGRSECGASWLQPGKDGHSMRVIHVCALKHPEAQDGLNLPGSVCAAGYFDGFHAGHRQLIDKAMEEAAAMGLASAVMTFDPDPWTVFHPQGDLHHLQTLQDKIELAAILGIDLFFVVHFDRAFAALSIEAFHRFVASLHIEKLVCGYDFTYGFKGQGNVQSLQQQKLFETSVIDPVTDHQEKISSTRIEALIRHGDVEEADRLLGTYYSIAGTVVSGFQRGSRLLQTPTANLDPDPEYVLPARGVYAGLAEAQGSLYPAMINIGKNPTFGNRQVSIEANLLNADLSLYGQPVRFFFAARLRPEMKFDGAGALEAQLGKDRENTIRILKEQLADCLQVSALWSFKPVFDILEK